MKSGTSSLNPYAASYVPLSKREMKDRNKVIELAPEDLTSSNNCGWPGPNEKTKQIQHQSRTPLYCNPHDNDDFAIPDRFSPRGNLVGSLYGSSSHIRNEMIEKQHILEEESEMELAYLQIMFPGVSDQSIADVYLVNKGDLEATVDMLNQLEFHDGDSFENLPDTLDIGDVSEFGSSIQSASSKSNVEGEASSSSAGPPGSVKIT